MKQLGMVLSAGLLALASCEDVIDLDPVDTRAAVEASVRPRPISGGTLIVTSDGMAVAADPDRDLVYLVDVPGRALVGVVTLEPGDEPGRVVEGSEGRVHVVLRGLGGLATFDRSQGSMEEGTAVTRRSVCPDPRGLAYDEAGGELLMACADGSLVRLDEATGQERSRTQLSPDLRDVVVINGVPIISQFRTARLLAENGSWAAPTGGGLFQPHVAWRTTVDGQGERIVMLHQLASVEPVPTKPEPGERDEEELPYGGSGG